MEFIEAIVIGLVVLLAVLPLVYVLCIQWMDCEPEPGHRGIGDMNPAQGLTSPSSCKALNRPTPPHGG